MDNLGSHKSAEIRRMLRTAGARLRHPPACSPDLNPIEQAFAKIEHGMRMARKRTVEETSPMSDTSSQQSRPTNAQTTSPTQAMLPSEPETF